MLPGALAGLLQPSGCPLLPHNLLTHHLSSHNLSRTPQAVGVAGVALWDIQSHFAWQVWHVPEAWQAWQAWQVPLPWHLHFCTHCDMFVFGWDFGTCVICSHLTACSQTAMTPYLGFAAVRIAGRYLCCGTCTFAHTVTCLCLDEILVPASSVAIWKHAVRQQWHLSLLSRNYVSLAGTSAVALALLHILWHVCVWMRFWNLRHL